MLPYLNELLHEAARRFPDRVAVEDELGHCLTYQELLARANAIATLLTAGGVKAGDRVGICHAKSITSVSCLFGVLHARAAYVPVDVTAPAKRSAYIFADCRVDALLVEDPAVPALVEALRPAADIRCQIVGEDVGLSGGLTLVTLSWHDTGPNIAAPEGIAYILYTSGSTGRPKGVVHTHDSARSFIEWSAALLNVTERDTFSSHAPFHFDLSIFDIYVAVKYGARLLLIGEEIGKQPQKLAALINDRNITVWYSTPAILRLLIEFGNLAQLPEPQLHTVIFAGEVFPLKYLKELQSIWPHADLYNFYGPTETNVCTYFKVPETLVDVPYDSLPIGHACSSDRCRVVDETGIDVTPGQEGELIVSGGSVMQAYWNLPERNRQAFLKDGNGDLWYRTGDMVTEHPEFGYLFIGRRDRMVKRRGYRVELGEIESALYKHESISEAAVIAKANDQGVAILAVIAWASAGKPSKIALKRYCAENLISYMIPDDFIFVTALPKTSTDKVDYQKILETM